MYRDSNPHTMAPDTAAPGDSEVMAAVDADGGEPRLVIADVAAEESWLSVPTAAAAPLADWR